MLKVIRKLLSKVLEDIDAGNSNITEEEGIEIVELLEKVSEPTLSKYSACRFLGVSRATFDNLIRDGKLPKGTKRVGFKELAWKKSDLIKFVSNYK